VDRESLALWLGSLVCLAGILGIVLRQSLQQGATWCTRRLLGERRAGRYQGPLGHDGWAGVAVLPGAVLVVVGISIIATRVAPN
jgi:uncharacterized membrane protein